MTRLILGSQSPRRKEILEYFSIPFEQVVPAFDEASIPFLDNPEEYVCAISQGKAASLAQKFPNAIILTADTIVYKDGKVYGKPKNKEEATSILQYLAGQWHQVYTGVTVRQGEEQYSDYAKTHVLFNSLTLEEIHLYHEKILWEDKAAGYAIQQSGSLIIRSIEGCYYNVLGLPIQTVKNLLARVGINLWEYL
ncbi:nucleoside triphosphate pyrophosphatase [Parachlamydia sp. AcF125]|uniref:Maf family protein n=1 Tax=Parachlamydia sp. AcF125 TaxID=2795736 RepID=UPI001BC9A30A|nr:nucleoside triphosphate pyrophosphatase [Parachlamydia sp. AcF125]MBS4168809.1 Septum formation protein Maf [Parachlamydia sp. AcF125]